ncbi:MAG: MEKHLA domain-containing protein [Desulfuromonadales bacterium]|nr:MEKHLA domain-containing protein [Desulfuromonadales bacterium]
MSDSPANNSSPLPTWADSLGKRLRRDTTTIPLLARQQRYQLLVRARWFFLSFVGLYGVGAILSYIISGYGWFLTSSQLSGFLVGLCVILIYNSLFQLGNQSLASHYLGDYLQLLPDFLCVTLLIYFSGGAASWLWPLYLLVTLEAAILLESRLKVILTGLFGSFCYGSVLGAEYFDILPNFSMPFVNADLHHHTLYLLLIWMWVSLLNLIVAVIGAYLMRTLRSEHATALSTENRLKDFLSRAHDLIFSITPDGRFIYANQAWYKTLGYSADDFKEMVLEDILDQEMRAKCTEEIRKATCGEKIDALEGRLVTKSGEVIATEGSLLCDFQDNEPGAVWIICRDVTARKKAQDQLHHMAHHDGLTGLPNRLVFADRVHQSLALAKREEKLSAVLFLDLDRFKIINDTLGHAVGDELLKAIARRLRDCIREIDTVARLGGDEFGVVLVNLNNGSDAEQVAAKFLRTLAKPVHVDQHELFVTTSIGISFYPAHGNDADTLIKRADTAMYQAKAQGRNNFQIYDQVMEQGAERRLIVESGMRKALERNEFRLEYQPKVDAESGQITALEALIRWQHPELGLLAPAEFISLAEETGLIVPMGEWVLREACRQNRAWQDAGLPKVRVAVNLSGFQLQHKSLVETVAGILQESGLDGKYLELEITETVIMQNPEFVAGLLSQLSDMDIHISIDDFGTGYSSLAHLKRFSVNTLKIDRSFVRDIEESSADEAITSAIISMGNSLNLKVIAEGVETEGQFALLREKHCDEMQGYLFSKPVSSEVVAELLKNGVPRRPAWQSEDV